jgi:hypothetical protein
LARTLNANEKTIAMKKTLLFGFLLQAAVMFAQQVMVQTVTTTTTYQGYPLNGYWNAPANTVFHAQPQVISYDNTPYFQVMHSQHYPSQMIQNTGWNTPSPAYFPNGLGQCGTPVYNGVMDDYSFGMVMQQISRQSFESNRLQIAQQIVMSNPLSSAQVASIMQLFSFESTRLEFARFAYGYVVDPQRYFLVNNAFAFSSSVDDLNRFLVGRY